MAYPKEQLGFSCLSRWFESFVKLSWNGGSFAFQPGSFLQDRLESLEFLSSNL